MQQGSSHSSWDVDVSHRWQPGGPGGQPQAVGIGIIIIIYNSQEEQKPMPAHRWQPRLWLKPEGEGAVQRGTEHAHKCGQIKFDTIKSTNQHHPLHSLSVGCVAWGEHRGVSEKNAQRCCTQEAS